MLRFFLIPLFFSLVGFFLPFLVRVLLLLFFRLLFAFLSENNSRSFGKFESLIIIMIKSRRRPYRVRIDPFAVVVVVVVIFFLLVSSTLFIVNFLHGHTHIHLNLSLPRFVFRCLLDSTKWSSSSHPEHQQLVRFNSSTSLQSFVSSDILDDDDDDPMKSFLYAGVSCYSFFSVQISLSQ